MSVAVVFVLRFRLEEGHEDTIAVLLANDGGWVEVSFQHDVRRFLAHDDRADVFPNRFLLSVVVSKFSSSDSEVVEPCTFCRTPRERAAVVAAVLWSEEGYDDAFTVIFSGNASGVEVSFECDEVLAFVVLND